MKWGGILGRGHFVWGAWEILWDWITIIVVLTFAEYRVLALMSRAGYIKFEGLRLEMTIYCSMQRLFAEVG